MSLSSELLLAWANIHCMKLAKITSCIGGKQWVLEASWAEQEKTQEWQGGCRGLAQLSQGIDPC